VLTSSWQRCHEVAPLTALVDRQAGFALMTFARGGSDHSGEQVELGLVAHRGA